MSDSKTTTDELTADEIETLEETHYNATIIERIDVHEDLARFRIRADAGHAPFQSGQYVALGLGNWEPRLRGTQPEDLPPKRARRLVRRAYSISCPMISSAGKLLPNDEIDYLEFYITLVRKGATPVSKPPGLTPRLFGKHAGDRITMERKITGKYILENIGPEDTVLFLGTGTGEAPHNSMAADLLARGHTGKIIIATSVRYRRDLAYLSEHQTLMSAFNQYIYLPLTTREVENLDSTHVSYVGKQYLQTVYESGQLAKSVDDTLTPDHTHVFLCGNPDMIGIIPADAPMPDQPGMVPLLRRAGFRDDVEEHGVGTIRYEKYW
ncbi:MAG: ferredoxin--NADP reductase [Planctomycetota bacterium]